MGLDALAPERFGPLRPALLRALGLMPVTALLALPLGAVVVDLYPFAKGAPAPTPLAAVWLTTPFVLTRLAAALALWIWLCRRAARPEPPLALVLGLHAVLATVLSFDLVTGLDPRLASSLVGLLVMGSWSGLALAAAILRTPDRPEAGAVPLALLLAAWPSCTSCSSSWSGRRTSPAEASWYLARGGLLGRALALSGGAAALLAAGLTLRPGSWATRAAAALALAVQVAGLAWWVTPAPRGAFVVTVPDILAGFGLAAVAVGLATFRTGRALEGQPA